MGLIIHGGTESSSSAIIANVEVIAGLIWQIILGQAKPILVEGGRSSHLSVQHSHQVFIYASDNASYRDLDSGTYFFSYKY